MFKLFYLLFLIYTFPVQSIHADGIIKEQNLATSPGKTLIVKADCGDVTISTWGKSEAYVKISGNDNAKDNYAFDISEKNGDIYVSVKKTSDEKSVNNISLKIEVSIPDKFNTEIATSGGDIHLENLSGNTAMKTAGGDIVIKNINGNTSLKTAGGDIKAESFSGEFNAKTAGGNINLTGSDAKINAKTAGGDVTVNYNGENKGMDLSTLGGNVNLYLPDNFGATLNLKTNSGEFKIGFDLKVGAGKLKHNVKGIINNGGELISCKSLGGNITVDKLK